MPTAFAVGISASRKSMFFQKKCLFSIPIPFRTLCWLCFVQSLVCPYFGILAENPFPVGRGYFAGATAPRPCRGLRPCDPIFRKYKGLSTVCNADGKSRRHFYISEYACRRYLLTGDIQLDKAFKHGAFGINIVLAVFGKYFYSGKAHSYFVVAFGILYKDGML